jgi:hypothetical protein
VVAVREPPRASVGVVRPRHAEPRLLVDLIATVVVCVVLMVAARLGASWPVVVVAVTGTRVSLWSGHLSRRLGLGLVLAVCCVGLLWIEAVNVVQYGTLALNGPPAKVCSVDGVDNGGPGVSCGATEPLLVQVGPGRYEVSNP